MALQYGLNITASDIKSLLEKNDKQQSGVRSWRQLFGNAALGFNAQSDALTTDYSDAIAKAYASSFKQNDAIMGAGLSAGITKEMLAASRNDLHTAYETYIRNYGNDVATLGENYGKEVSAINTALTERATNFANLYNSAYNYLAEELYGATLTEDDYDKPIYEGKGKKATLTGYEQLTRDYITEHGLSWAVDKDGNLLPWEILSNELVNADGSLTQRGVQFFDQMFNTKREGYMHADGERAVRSFDQWLSEQEDTFSNYDATNLPGMAKNGRALRDWWVGQDDFNYTFAGTNKGTAQTMTGRESTDDKYGAHEYVNTSGMRDFAEFDFDKLYRQADTAFTVAENTAAYYAEVAERASKNARAGASVYNPNADEQYAKARTAWQTYYNTFSGMYDKLNKFFTEKMGSSLADQFWTKNTKLRDEYDSLMRDAKNSEYSNENIANKLNDWYQRLLKQMNAYIKQHGYKGKTSGF